MILLLPKTVCAVFDDIFASTTSTCVGNCFLYHAVYLTITYLSTTTDVDTLKEAKRTGADEVLARTRFVTAMPELIQKYVKL